MMNHSESTVFAICSMADGSASTAVVTGKEALRKRLCEHLFDGTYEKAKEDDVCLSYLEDLDSSDLWENDGRTLNIDLEQGSIFIFVVDEVLTPADEDEGYF